MHRLLLIPAKIVHLIKIFPGKFFYFIKHFPIMIHDFFFDWVLETASFMLLLVTYMAGLALNAIGKFKLFPGPIDRILRPIFSKVYNKILTISRHDTEAINRVMLIELALRNMRVKKSRTTITIGGMSLGIGAIVFLVSLGYGVQNLVISRVARLDEMRQADVNIAAGSNLKISDKTISDFKNIPNVEQVLPQIAVVGRVNFQNSISDMAVYGVTSEYLNQSAVKPVEGKNFESNDTAKPLTSQTQQQPEVAGVSISSSKIGDEIGNIQFEIEPNTWVKVRKNPDKNSQLFGYTRRIEGNQQGTYYWGTSYPDNQTGLSGSDQNGKPLGKWIKSDVLLWQKKLCQKSDPDCVDGQYIIDKDNSGKQIQTSGYFAQINIRTFDNSPEITSLQVLGESTSAAELITSTTATSAADLELLALASEAAELTEQKSKSVPLGKSAIRQAVVNRAMLKVLGITDGQAVGKTFNASFVVVGDLLADATEKIESVPIDYTIVGVVPDEKSPIFYVPFIDLRSLGIEYYSQIKIVAKNQDSLAKIRQQIEASGFNTSSVADTVQQINSLFATVRTILALLGMVALAVAALGMFNTLTVSLLERTREVGLMKAMGMKSKEVKELFLTESMIMGFFGGVLGVAFGFLSGKLISGIISIFAISKGVGFIDISFIPLTFILFIVVLSLLVGLITGIYPARRATKISALNAMRYE